MEKKVIASCYCRKIKSNSKKYLVLVEYPTCINSETSSQAPTSATRAELYKNESKFQQKSAPSQVIPLDDLIYVDIIYRKKPLYGLILITESSYFLFALESADQQLWLRDNLRFIVCRNRKENLYPHILCAFESQVKFKQLATEPNAAHHSQFRLPMPLSSCRFLMTHETIMLVASSIKDPEYVIHYHFIRGYSSRDDGRLSLNLGRASPLGECEVVIQLADKVESCYAHKQCLQISTSCKDQSAVQRSRSIRSTVQSSRVVLRRNSGMMSSVNEDTNNDSSNLRTKRLSSTSLASSQGGGPSVQTTSLPIVFSPTLISSFASPCQGRVSSSSTHPSHVIPTTASSPNSVSSLGSSSMCSTYFTTDPLPSASSIQKRFSNFFVAPPPSSLPPASSSLGGGGGWRPWFAPKAPVQNEEGSTLEATLDTGEVFSTGETIITPNDNEYHLSGSPLHMPLCQSSSPMSGCGGVLVAMTTSSSSDYANKLPLLRSSQNTDRFNTSGRFSLGIQRYSYQPSVGDYPMTPSDTYVPMSPSESFCDPMGSESVPPIDNHYVLMSPSSASDTSSIREGYTTATRAGQRPHVQRFFIGLNATQNGSTSLPSQQSESGVDRVASYLGEEVHDDHSHYKRAYSLGTRPLLRSLIAEVPMAESEYNNGPHDTTLNLSLTESSPEKLGNTKPRSPLSITTSTTQELSPSISERRVSSTMNGSHLIMPRSNTSVSLQATTDTPNVNTNSTLAPSLSGHRDDALLFMEVNYVDRPRTSSDSRAQRPKSHSVFPPIGNLFRMVREATVGVGGTTGSAHSSTSFSSRRTSNPPQGGGGGGGTTNLSSSHKKGLIRRTTVSGVGDVNNKGACESSIGGGGETVHEENSRIASPSGTSSSVCSVPSSGLQSGSVTSLRRGLSDCLSHASVGLQPPTLLTTEDSGVEYMEPTSSGASFTSSCCNEPNSLSSSAVDGKPCSHQHHHNHHHHHHPHHSEDHPHHCHNHPHHLKSTGGSCSDVISSLGPWTPPSSAAAPVL